MRRDLIQSRLQGSLYIFSFAALSYFFLDLLVKRLVTGTWNEPIHPVVFTDMFIFAIAAACAWAAFRLPKGISGRVYMQIGFVSLMALAVAASLANALLEPYESVALVLFGSVAVLGSIGSFMIVGGYIRAVREFDV